MYFFKKIWHYLFGKRKKSESVAPLTEAIKIHAPVSSEKVNYFVFQFIDDFPLDIDTGVVYIVGEGDFHWQLVLKCPCGCSETIQLNLLNDASPQWEYRITKKNKITIYPSVWRNKGCKSHFILKNGIVNWVNPKK